MRPTEPQGGQPDERVVVVASRVVKCCAAAVVPLAVEFDHECVLLIPGVTAMCRAGMSLPSGHAAQRLNPVAGHDHDPSTVKQPEYLHYGMQLGSGTWDVNAGLVYLGETQTWQWGARVALTSRLGQRNADGYAWGDRFESSAWLGYALTQHLALSLRGLATVQGKIKGRFDAHRELDVVSGEVQWVEGDAGAGSRRLVHLTVDQRHLALGQVVFDDDAAFDELVIEVVSFAGTLADASEHREAALGLGDVVN